MKLIGNELRKYEHILDIFKGTCELNNFEGMQLAIFDDKGKSKKNIVEEALNSRHTDSKKVFFYSPIMDDEETMVLGALSVKTSPYTCAELINLAVKILTNLDIEDISVTYGGRDEKLQENLEALSIAVDLCDDKSFGISVDDKETFIGGQTEDDIFYIFVDYKILSELTPYKEKTEPLDAYIVPTDKEVFDDAFIIGSNLREAGFKVEVDYSLVQVTKENVDATFLITFDASDIAKYEVKLIDMATREIKHIKIDNLIEEMMFI